MLGLLYLAIATAVGAELCKALLPSLSGAQLPREQRAVAPWVIAWPAAFLTGTLLMTWATYLTAWSLRSVKTPLAPANAIVMTLSAVVVARLFLRRRRVRENADLSKANATRWQWLDFAVCALGLVVAIALMLHTAYVEGTTLVLGRTAFGDLNIHLGMARSFSHGSNFPTGYPAYAGTDIRYHFMFYFLVGNLEFLGLRLDWALNLPCILSFTAVVLLLYGLASVLGRDRRVGLLAVIFLLFRSSPSFISYLAHLKAPTFAGRVTEIAQTDRFIGITANESWGIWTLNIFIVERHFAFALGLVLIAVLYLVRATGMDGGVSLFQGVNDSTHTPAFDRS